MNKLEASLQTRTQSIDRTDLSAHSGNFEHIPNIDISELWADELPRRQKVADAIGAACRDVGFFYVSNHGISRTVIDEVYQVADAFFRLPTEKKSRYEISRIGRHRGYVAIGDLAADAHDQGAFDFHEAYEVSLELPPNDPDYLAGNLMYGPNIWPDEPINFRATVYRYFEALLGLGRDLFRGFALALNLPENYFAPKITKPMAQLRVLHYPPQPEPIDPRHIGVGAHTDYECFTVLASSAPGLQILNAQQQWIEAAPPPGALVINIGDAMARWTNDEFLSTVHRVINVSGGKRFSLPFFFGANYDAEIRCLESCLSNSRPARYAPISAGEWTVSNISAAYAYRKEAR